MLWCSGHCGKHCGTADYRTEVLACEELMFLVAETHNIRINQTYIIYQMMAKIKQGERG